METVTLNHQVLRTDVSGMPLEWVGYQDAVRLYHLGQVAYTCGTLLYRIRGGINARTGERSLIEVNSIIATQGRNHALVKQRERYVPPLNNPALFRRDSQLCLSCGETFRPRDLSRDHVSPVIQGGLDTAQRLLGNKVVGIEFKRPLYHLQRRFKLPHLFVHQPQSQKSRPKVG